MSIGNIPSSIRAKPTSHAWIPIALLPIGPKRLHKQPGWSAKKQEQEALEAVHDILRLIFRPISDSAKDGISVTCGDGVQRRCYFRLTAWLADHQENCTIHAIYNNRCTICECPVDELGSYPSKHQRRDFRKYTTWMDDSDVQQLKSAGVKQINNALWSLLDSKPCDLVRPDLLHNMYLGNIEYLMGWIEGFLTVHNRLHAFDDIWAKMSTYPGNPVPRKPYRYLTQVKGKEMRAIHYVILGVFTAALERKSDMTSPTGGQAQDFKKAILAVRYLTDFGLLARYRSHTDSTINYMSTYLR